MNSASHWRWFHTISLGLILSLLVSLSWYSSLAAKPLVYVAAIFLLGLFIAVAGHGVKGLWGGAIMDNRNMMSLSELQIVLWTVVILAGLIVAAVTNLALDAPDPLEIAIPENVWALLGLSTVSLVASPLIKETKESRRLDPQIEAQAYEKLRAEGVNPTNLDSEGVIARNRTPEEASWADLFQGEEIGNAGQLDLAKIQMFLFTIILVIIYAISLSADFSQGEPIESFPSLSEGMVALLAISHAGYWTHKAIPHTTTT